jgi:hypothetical protein
MPSYPAVLTPADLHKFRPMPTGVVIEPEAGPWKNNVHWGDGFSGPLPKAAGVEVPVFSGEEIVGPPRVQTVQLFRDDSRAGMNADFRAHVQYGVGAASNEFFCDWGQGAQFSIVCNWVRVTAVSYAPFATVPYNASSAPIQISAMVVEGTVAQGRALRFTEPTITLPPTTLSAAFNAPDFARGVLLYANNILVTPGTPTGVNLLLENEFGFVAAIVDSALTLPEGILFPGPFNRARIDNTTAGPGSVDATLVWVLGL